MGERLILPLQARPAGDPTLVGAKAAGLNLLLRNGFPVPPGFCVLPSLTAPLRGLPPDFRRSIGHAYGRLGTLVAIRPSTVSPAKTLLGINGEEAAARAVARCMAAHGDLRTSGSCPVIIQKLVDAISSGIAHGRNPENGDETEVLIESGWGIGQPSPTGNAKPDLFRVRKYPLLLLTSEPAAKVRETRAGPVGLVDRPLPQPLRLAPSLTDPEAIALAQLVRRIEKRLGHTVRIEWALTKSGFVLLELDRTAEPPQDSFYLNPPLAGGRRETISALEATEIPAGVISPLAWDFWSRAADAALRPLLARAGLSPAAKIPPLVLVAGRVYLNVTDLGLALEQTIGLAQGSLSRLAASEGKKHAGPIALSRLRPRSLIRLLALLNGLRRLDRERVRLVRGELDEESERLDRLLQQQLSPVQLATALAGVDSFLLERVGILLATAIAADRFRRFQRLLRRWCGPGGETAGAQLVAGLGTLETAAPGYALWDLAWWLKAANGAAESRGLGAGNNAQAILAAFVTEHGHHCAGEFDPAVPRWGDNPATIASITTNLDFPGDTPAEEHARQQAALRSQATAWVQGRLSAGWRRFFFRRRHRLTRIHARLLAAYPMIENAKSALVRLLWRYRRLLILAGEELTGREYLDRPDDIFLLRIEEIRAAISGEPHAWQAGGRIRQRAEAAELYGRLHPPSIITGPYRVSDFTVPTPAAASALRGLGASPGRGRGPARLIRSASDLVRFLPGEVLVAPKIDAGWGPFLLRAQAIVTELGGLMSKAAVLAREYGLPAVVRAEGALSCLQDGDVLEVDGETGEIRLEQGKE